MVIAGFDFSHLSGAERLELAEALWNSVLGTPDEPQLDRDQIAEMDRRLELLRADPTRGKPWREVMDRLDREFGG
jgi:putative addiction module component (TIGR02574 family)